MIYAFCRGKLPADQMKRHEHIPGLLEQILRSGDREYYYRAPDVKKAQDLINSRSVSEFKSDFCRLKVAECRNILERHEVDVEMLWNTKVPETFDFVTQNSEWVKM